MPHTFTALTIDIVGSRKYQTQDRKTIQRHFDVCTEYLNNRFQSAMAKKVIVSAGDELQGLFLSPQAAILYYRLFVLLTLPIKTRAGIGCGNWDTISPGENSFAQDGTAYHYAREAIESVNDKDRHLLFLSHSNVDQCVNKILQESFNIFTDLKTYNREILFLTELLSPIKIESTQVGDYGKILEIISDWQKTPLYGHEILKMNFNNQLLYDSLSKNPIVPENCQNFYVTEGRPKNLSALMGDILGISRQAVEKKYKTCRITEERNSIIVVSNYLQKVFL